ncbi:MAG: hypothetical protein CSA45_00785 [Gammaproteobacteria bacterium]|nr:MAG: hypothetical protein CSA45_00785 [Gammaproteobacteria bacterium]
MKKSILFLLISALSIFSYQAYAHGVWLAERVGEQTIVLGEGAVDDAYQPEKVLFVKSIDKDGNITDAKINKHEKNVSVAVDDNATAIVFRFDNGFWTQNQDGKWVNRPKNEVESAKSAGRYMKSGIAIVNKGSTVKPIADFDLQIVPKVNPLTLKAGDKLVVTVLFKGKPVKGAKVMRDYNNYYTDAVNTDENGEAEVVIRNEGLNVIAVGHKVDVENDPKADKYGYMSTLSFTFPFGE